MTSVSLKRFDVVDIKILLDYLEEHNVGMPRLWKAILRNAMLRQQLDKAGSKRLWADKEIRSRLNECNLSGSKYTHILKKGKEYQPSDDEDISLIWEDTTIEVQFASLHLIDSESDELLLITTSETGYQTHWEVDQIAIAHVLLRYPLIDRISCCSDGERWLYFYQQGLQVACVIAGNDDYLEDIEDLDQ
jgi:hypothetical protein